MFYFIVSFKKMASWTPVKADTSFLSYCFDMSPLEKHRCKMTDG